MMKTGLAVIFVILALVATPAQAVKFDKANFGEVFAKEGNDPYPGEDLIKYCSRMANNAGGMLKEKLQGKTKEVFTREIRAVQIKEEPEREAVLNTLDWVFEHPEYKLGIKIYLAAGRWCLKKRLKGTWYTYDWRSDPEYPKHIDRETQQIVEY